MGVNNHAVTIWFTGLPCSGKSTLANLLKKRLRIRGYKVEILDGDFIRKNFSRDLGFSKEDRKINIERITFMANLLTRNGIIVIVSLISPYRQMRDFARGKLKNFVEVFTKCPIEICQKHDKKGLYIKAYQGQISNFTGVSDPYEESLNPEIVLHTDKQLPEECTDIIMDFLKNAKKV